MTSYLRWIRQHVGRQKILLVYASACIQDHRGRLLWQRRADLQWWGLPGGVLELGESLPECVVREVHEETGLRVAPERLVGIYSSPDFDVTYPNGDQVQQVTACFKCQLQGGVGKADGVEGLDLGWFELADPPPTAPWYTAMVADLASDRPGANFDRGRAGDGRSQEPYFRGIRRRIGTAPYIMPAAAAFIQDEAGQVLLQRRGDTGKWGLPGGAMELGERVDRTAVSEVREETGLEVEPVRLVGVYSDDMFWVTYPNGDQVKVASSLFQCRVVGGALQADGIESLEVRFFPPDGMPPLPKRHARRVRDGLAGTAEAVF
jgi:8-oxo-dGTP pyrophosphatase MutT (NUDIX family)